MNYKQFRAKKELKAADVVVTLQEGGFSGFNKHILSYAENPEKYAVCLIPDAEDLIKAAFGQMAEDSAAPQKRPKRKKAASIYYRCTKKRQKEIRTVLTALGFKTVQDGMDYILDKFLAEHKKAEEKTCKSP